MFFGVAWQVDLRRGPGLGAFRHGILSSDLGTENPSRGDVSLALSPVRAIPADLLSRHSEAKLLEARTGVEPVNKGFADLCLTTWLPRLKRKTLGRAVWASLRTIPRGGRGSQFRHHRQQHVRRINP